MRSTSVGRVGRPTGIPTAVADAKKISPWSRQTERPCVSGIEPKITARPTSVQKLRPASQLTPAKPATNLVVLELPSTPSRSTTPTSLNRSSSAQRTRTSSIQSIFVKPAAPGTPVPIEQRSKFSTTRGTPSKTDNNLMSSGSPLGQVSVTPVRSRTPSRTGVSGASNIGSLKAMVGPYSFFLKELKKEKNMYLRDESKEKDLRTIMNQLTLFRFLLDKKLSEDRSTEEKLLLIAWQLVYDAEEEAFGLKSKERIALEINKIHGQLIDMDTRITQVNNFLAPVFEKLSTYVNLRMAQVEVKEEVVENISFIRSVTDKMSASREYSASILNLEKAVRVLERMVEKRDRLLNTSIKSQVGKLDSFHNTPDLSPKGSETNTSPFRVGFDQQVLSPKRITVIPPNATVPIAPRHFMAPTTSFRIKVDTPAVKESEGVHSVHDKTLLSAPKKQISALNLKGIGGSFLSQNSDTQPITPIKTTPSMVHVNSSSSLNKLATPKSVATPSGTSSSQESPLPLKKPPSFRNKASPMVKVTSGIPVHSARAAAANAVSVTAGVAPTVNVVTKVAPSRKNSFLADLPDVTIVEDDDEFSDEETDVTTTTEAEVQEALEVLRIDTTLSPKGPVPSKELVRTMSDMPRTNSSNTLNSRPSSANSNALKSPGQIVTRTASAATFDDFAKLAKSPTLPRTSSSTFDDFASKLASLENLGFASYAVAPIVKPQTSKSNTPITVQSESPQPVVAPVLVKVEPPTPPSTKSVAADFLAKRRAQMNASQAQEIVAVVPIIVPVVVPAAASEAPLDDASTTLLAVEPLRAIVASLSLSQEEEELHGAFIEQEFAIQSPVAEVVALHSGSEASVALSKSLEQLQAASPPRSPSTPFFTLSRGSSFREVQPRTEAVSDVSSRAPPPAFEEAVGLTSSAVVVDVEITSSHIETAEIARVDDIPPPVFEDVEFQEPTEVSPPVGETPASVEVAAVVTEHAESVALTEPPVVVTPVGVAPTNGIGNNAYSNFFNRKSVEATIPATQPAVVTETPAVQLEVAPPVIVAPAPSKSAYSSFLAKKSSGLPVSPPSVSYTEPHQAPKQSITEAHNNLTVRTSFMQEAEVEAAEVSPVVTPLAAQAINPSANTKSAYAAFLSKKPSQTIAKSDTAGFSYTEDSYIAPLGGDADNSMVEKIPVPRPLEAVTASVAVVAEAERIASSKSAYSEFFSKKNTSGDSTPITNKTDNAFTYTEPGYSTEVDNFTQPVPVETAPARVVSTKSAYSDFLARKPSPARDHPTSEAASSSFSYTVDTYVAPVSSGEHPMAILETKEELAVCAKAVEALAASPVSNVYGDFLKKRSVRVDPVMINETVSELPSIDEKVVSVADIPSVPSTPTKGSAYSSFVTTKPSFREVGSSSSTPIASPLLGFDSVVSPSSEQLSPDSKKALSAQSAYNSFLTKKTSFKEAHSSSADEIVLDVPRVASPVAQNALSHSFSEESSSSGVLVKKTSFREVLQLQEEEKVVTENSVIETVASSVKVEETHVTESVSTTRSATLHTETQHSYHTSAASVTQEMPPPAPQRAVPAAPLTLEEKIALALGGIPQPPKAESRPILEQPVLEEVKPPIVQTATKHPVDVESPASDPVVAPVEPIKTPAAVSFGELKMEPIVTDMSSSSLTAQTGIATYSPADHLDTQSVQSVESYDQSPGRPPAYVQGLPPLNKRPSISSESASVDLSGNDPHKTPKKNTSMHKFLTKTFSVSSSSSKKDKRSDSIDLAELSALEGSLKGSVDGGSVNGNNGTPTTTSAQHEDSLLSPDAKKTKSAVSMFKKSLFGSGKKKT